MRPKIRFLDIQPYGDRFVINDPLGISQPLLISGEMLFILSFFDGNRDLREVQAQIFRTTGQLIEYKELEEIVKLLDENYLLLNERFLNKLEEERKKILSSGVRKPSHAGEAYPENPEELKNFIESILDNSGKEDALGIVVPHMDLRVAKKVYGKVYGKLKEKDYDLVVLLGVSHYYHENPFSILPLDLETPLGVIKTDIEKANKIREKFEFDIFSDVFAYKNEHSIDFQTIFIKYLFPNARVIPSIISYGDRELLKKIASEITKQVEKAKKPLIISSVDFSHVGRKFGDTTSYDPSFRDKEYINYLSELKNDEAFELLERDNNRTRIDGQFTNFVFIEILRNLGAKEGKLIDYEIYNENFTDSKVSYAGMIFK